MAWLVAVGIYDREEGGKTASDAEEGDRVRKEPVCLPF